MATSSRENFESNLSCYFRRRLTEAMDCLNASADEDTLWYLGRTLAHFGLSRHLFSYEDGTLTLRPLALLYHDARTATNEWERCALLRMLGDTALFVGALFPQNYHRRGLDQNYFIGMGKNAYQYVSEKDSHNPSLFRVLANEFSDLLELVAEACEKEHFFDAADMLQVYERWLVSGSPSLAKKLTRAGWILDRGHS